MLTGEMRHFSKNCHLFRNKVPLFSNNPPLILNKVPLSFNTRSLLNENTAPMPMNYSHLGNKTFPAWE